MSDNPLLKLRAYGQSIWLDYIRRNMLLSGELKQLIDQDGLRGVTSNPSIFEKAITGSHDYDEAIRDLAREGKSVEEIYQTLTIADIQRAADVFRPVYDELEGRDGFVSLEVSPHLAYDTQGTISEAHRLWEALDRPNVLIKVPATEPGLAAVQQLISDGINVNVTLLFGLPRYRRVADAYISGLEARVQQGKSIDRMASVASFFLSRIDVLVDPKLENIMSGEGSQAELAGKLHGQLAIASARVAYQIYLDITNSERFAALADHGARPQRLLWASTSTKNPAYDDVKYVEALIGPQTVNTLPTETLNAYRDHGNPASRLQEGVSQARDALARLPDLGIDIAQVTQQLEEEGVEKFNKPYDKLMAALQDQRAKASEVPLDRQSYVLGDYQSSIQERLDQFEQARFVSRLWQKDASLWKSDPDDQAAIHNALGWLHVAEKMVDNMRGLLDFAASARQAGFCHVLHMGMGGSSLAPLCFQRVFAPGSPGLPLTVLDTNDPATIRSIEQAIPLADTLFIVASKSGTTAETRALGDYFYDRVKAIKGDQAGDNFVAITDPGTPLVDLAERRGFRKTFLNFADIGGRYSALSYFGMVPAALMGLDVDELLVRALRMAHACVSCVSLEHNPGAMLGVALGELGRQGRNKITFLTPVPIAALGMWLEQLLAESTGKEGTGLLPVAGEPLGEPSAYGNDRFFVYLRLRDGVDDTLERGVAALQKAGHPVVTIQLDDRLDVAQEFFRWEFATAVAGAILGINAFDQPNVQESKDNTKRLLKEVSVDGHLPDRDPSLTEGPLTVYASESADGSLDRLLAVFLGRAKPGDYVDLMAYLPETPETERMLHAMQQVIRDKLHCAATMGYGPRFLHSTGQYHKGGPNNGAFLQLTVTDPHDVPVPDAPYTFGTFKHAEALGDLQALRQHERRVIQVDLGTDVIRGLKQLRQALDAALV